MKQSKIRMAAKEHTQNLYRPVYLTVNASLTCENKLTLILKNTHILNCGLNIHLCT